ncbi:bifunctional diguanylate cyclase/phosphodiesterase [Undibacterium squillarum]|uniref:bifunctional diguanylate cyclase/phosphodiesterase n=1 Tax=Undibacterium squillarum TaxID=1131567 RepID=UPI0035AF76F9
MLNFFRRLFPATTPPGSVAGRLLLVTGLYALSGFYSFSVPFQNAGISLIWLPVGIAFGALLRWGTAMLPAVIAGALIMNLYLGHSPLAVAVLTAGSTLGPWLGCRLLQYYGFDPALQNRRQVLTLMAGAAAGSAVSAITGSIWHAGNGLEIPPLSALLVWWGGDALGAMLTAPVFLTMTRRAIEPLRHQMQELLILLTVMTIASWAVFFSPFPELHLPFLLLGLMIWPAMRFEIPVTATLNLLVVISATYASSIGSGVFEKYTGISLLTRWGFIFMLTMISLITTALRKEHQALSHQMHEAYNRLQKLASRLPGLAIQCRIHADQRITVPYASDALSDMFELSYDEVQHDGTRLLARAHPEDFEAGRALLREATRHLTPWQCEFRYFRKDGSERWLYMDGLPEAEEDGAMLWHCFITDITERKQAESDLMIAACTFESQEAIFVTGPDWRILRINHAFSRITGFTPADLIGEKSPLLEPGAQSDDVLPELIQTLATQHFWHGELWHTRCGGDSFPVMITLTALHDHHGRLSHYVGSFTDISKHKGYEAEIRNLAFYDSLTQLPNRRLLTDRLDHLLRLHQHSHAHSAVLFIDLDNFKTLNDTRGHDAGDLLLIEAARRLRESVRDSDTVARLGGDEFVVVLESLSESREEAVQQTDRISEKIRNVLNQPFQFTDFEHHASCSIGVCLFNDQDVTVKDLFKRADTAMYEAKTAGKNAVRFFDPAMQAILLVRMLLESNLRVALSQDQFQLYYQVQVNAAGDLLGAEALLRWYHPDRGFISPGEFIPVAEEAGLIIPIGRWVLETACAQLHQWQHDPLTADLTLAVNVSARQFRQSDFVEQVRSMIQQYAFPPDRLKIELTESTVLDDVDTTIRTMQDLRKLGVGFSMDDFGTGYSSLAYLQKLPLTQLKIDQSFVRDLSEDENDATIVRAIISLGVNLGLDVIAEGVETDAQREFLMSHHCNAFQGYLFSRPLPLPEFEKLVRERRTTMLPQL